MCLSRVASGRVARVFRAGKRSIHAQIAGDVAADCGQSYPLIESRPPGGQHVSKPTYDNPRPAIPAAVTRLVLVEAGHACSVKDCREHTYVELHHIDENRENNDPDNLIVLCDKHHKMAHAGKIDRKALKLYKEMLTASRDADILARIERLEAQRANGASELPVAASTDEQPVDNGITKLSASRSAVQAFAMCQVAITKYEQETRIYFERHVEFVTGGKRLVLDGLHQSVGDTPDVIVDFSYIRRSYLDAPAYATWLREKLEVYEVMTGRKAIGVLLGVVGRENMLRNDALPMIRQSVLDNEGVTLKLYSFDQVGFDPGPVSAGVISIARRATAGL